MTRKAPRIQDVARLAGVSTATVSRALSNPDKLTPKTRTAVQDAIRSTGYRVNPMARNLRKQQAGSVMILVPNLGNPFFSEILAGLSAGLAGSEYSALIADSSERRQKGRLLDFFEEAQVDGMISLDGGLTREELERFGQRRIVFACEWVQDAPFPSVRSDNVAGARLAMRHLHELGHSKIAHITGPEGNVLTHMRREGMVAERAALGLETRDEWIIRGDFTLQSGYDAARQIMSLDDPPTAVFCASDLVACGLVKGLKELGVSVPEDMSVVGFDDIEMAAFFDPALTTIRQDRRQLGRRAADLLLKELASPVRGSDQIEQISVELVVRGSTRALGAV